MYYGKMQTTYSTKEHTNQQTNVQAYIHPATPLGGTLVSIVQNRMGEVIVGSWATDNIVATIPRLDCICNFALPFFLGSSGDFKENKLGM